MSELTDWIDKTCDECDRECRVAGSTEDLQKDPFKAQAHTIAARIRWHLRAHDAEIREQARREQLEADCDAAAGFRMGDRYASDAIRTAYAKAHPEREKKEAERAE